MTRVLVLGGGGMLGAMVTRTLALESEFSVHATTREAVPPSVSRVAWTVFDAERDLVPELLADQAADWIVNCIGVIKPRIDESDPDSVLRAIAANAVFPRRLAAVAAKFGQRVVEIATDGVFSGAAGPYDENSAHDPLDVYGKTKSLGEQSARNVVRLRCSVIGPEVAHPPQSSLGRTLAAPAGTTLTGFTAQRWNGVTTLHFARLCVAIIRGAKVDGLQHVVPGDSVTKADLLECIALAHGREDLKVTREPGPAEIDRRLVTRRPEINRRLWHAAGYSEPPTVQSMVSELAALAD
jgi:dTDP-4-dehydrorhamnose reductase